jgi:hypothetical protein
MPKEHFKMNCPLMMAYGDGKGDFVDWLKKLGVSDIFLRTYPLSKLVEWGWLRPQYRVVFPEIYFSDGSRKADELLREEASKNLALSELWESQWFCDSEKDPMWFIHPFFNAESTAGQLLNQNSIKTGLPEVPRPVEMANGQFVSPYADYYFPWQAFALLDVIRAADRFQHFVMDTPDVQLQVESLTRLTKIPSWNPHEYLDLENHWGGHAEVMTWLAHYAVLKDAVDQREGRHGHSPEMLRRGANALAAHLGFDADRLEGLVKDRLLVLAQRWKWGVEPRNPLSVDAYPYIQNEIYLAVHWLCMLTGNTLDHYLDLWRYPTRGQQTWAELHSILPFEYYEIRDKFLELAPFYLKQFTERISERYRLDGDRLAAVVDALRAKSRHFNVFMGAFKKLHDELGGDRKPTDVIDFRERQPLDYYLLIAIKAEVCFREELRETGILDGLKNQKLSGYLERLGTRAGLDATTIKLFKDSVHTYTKLHSEPTDGIRRIMNLGSTKPSGQIALVQGMICCELARNYFAHHDYMDAELLNGLDSQFLLGGILVCLLVLLDNPQS